MHTLVPWIFNPLIPRICISSRTPDIWILLPSYPGHLSRTFTLTPTPDIYPHTPANTLVPRILIFTRACPLFLAGEGPPGSAIKKPPPPNIGAQNIIMRLARDLKKDGATKVLPLPNARVPVNLKNCYISISRSRTVTSLTRYYDVANPSTMSSLTALL